MQVVDRERLFRDLVWVRVILILVLIFVNAGQALGRIISLFRFSIEIILTPRLPFATGGEK